MINLYGGEMTDIMPDNLKKDPTVQAMSCAISNMVKKTVEYSKRAAIYASIDSMEEPVLDLLAVELRTKYYGDLLSLEEKREMIKKTLPWYFKAGTLQTVQELTNFVFQDAKVEEWFTYGSDAYLFRIMVNIIDQDISLKKYKKFLESMYAVKNTRSHLEAVIFTYKQNADVKTAAAGGIGNRIKIKTRVATGIRTATEDKAATVLYVNQNICVKTDNSIKENDVYVLSETGERKRITTEDRNVVRI